MAELDLVDETYIVTTVAELETLREEQTWATWFPRIALTCHRDRGERGKRWTVSGELAGSAEVWFEPYADGVIVHIYLRVGWTVRVPRRRGCTLFRNRYVLPLKDHIVALKDACEVGRRPGEPRSDCSEQVVSAPRPASSLRRISGA